MKDDVAALKNKLSTSINTLIGMNIDLDDIFNDIGREEELKFAYNQDIDTSKSSICEKLYMKVDVGLMMQKKEKKVEI